MGKRRRAAAPPRLSALSARWPPPRWPAHRLVGRCDHTV